MRQQKCKINSIGLYFQHKETSSNLNNSLRKKLNNHSGSYKHGRPIKTFLSKNASLKKKKTKQKQQQQQQNKKNLYLKAWIWKEQKKREKQKKKHKINDNINWKKV